MELFDLKYTKAYAELNIIGTNLDTDKISKMLGMRVDYVRSHGDYSTQKNNSVSISPAIYPGEEAIWTYKTEERETEELGTQLDDIVTSFKDKISALNNIKEIFVGSRINISIVLYNHQKLLPGISLNAEQVAFLSNIGAGIDFDIYNVQESNHYTMLCQRAVGCQTQK